MNFSQVNIKLKEDIGLLKKRFSGRFFYAWKRSQTHFFTNNRIITVTNENSNTNDYYFEYYKVKRKKYFKLMDECSSDNVGSMKYAVKLNDI